jgi:hypothetical protein
MKILVIFLFLSATVLVNANPILEFLQLLELLTDAEDDGDSEISNYPRYESSESGGLIA